MNTVIVTPEIAKEMIDFQNNNNRPIVNSKIKKLAKIMLDGEWNKDFVEGNLIVLDEKGNILSGQHRLRAQIEAGFTNTYIVNTVNRAQWLRISIEQRSQADRLKMSFPFVLNATHLSVILGRVTNIIHHGYAGQANTLKVPVENQDGMLIHSLDTKYRSVIRYREGFTVAQIEALTTILYLTATDAELLNHTVIKDWAGKTSNIRQTQYLVATANEAIRQCKPSRRVFRNSIPYIDKGKFTINYQ